MSKDEQGSTDKRVPTPRTDAAKFFTPYINKGALGKNGEMVVLAEIAEQLERELAEWRKVTAKDTPEERSRSASCASCARPEPSRLPTDRVTTPCSPRWQLSGGSVMSTHLESAARQAAAWPKQP